jgi:predicted metal-dependent phosphoesterase TrpH
MTTPRRNQVDLHTHTARSDGVLEPVVLFEQMRAWGSELVAVTDHDTLAGVREILSAGLGAGREGPEVIVGVEINSLPDDDLTAAIPERRDGAELHILGLGVDPEDASFEARLAAQRRARSERLELMLQRLDELGLPVRDHLPAPAGGIDALGRPHVARALVATGHATSVDDAFVRYLAPGAPAYVRRVGMGTRDAIRAIATAGGIPVLAHSPWAPEAPWVIDRLIDAGLRGLEVHYQGWDDETIDRMARFAQARRLLATGGSDYHGDGGDYAAAQACTYVPSEVASAIRAASGSEPR